MSEQSKGLDSSYGARIPQVAGSEQVRHVEGYDYNLALRVMSAPRLVWQRVPHAVFQVRARKHA